MIEGLEFQKSRNFKDTKLENLAKVNIIFGSNGNGKTKLANIISQREKEAGVNIEGDLVGVRILVLNSNFIEELGKEGSLNGVYTIDEKKEKLGVKDLKQEEKKLTKLVKDKDKCKNVIEETNKNLVHLKETFTKNYFNDILKKYINLYPSIFSKYENDEKSFKEALEKKLKDYDNNSPEEDNEKIEELLEKNRRLLNTSLQQKSDKINPPDYGEIIKIENNKIWTKEIENKGSNFLSKLKLIQRKDQDSDSTEDEELIKRLSKNYSEAVDVYLKQMFYKNDYIQKNKDILNLKPIQREYKEIQNLLTNNKKQILAKAKNFNSNIDIKSSKELLLKIEKLISINNINIDAYNEQYNNHINTLKKEIWNTLIQTSKPPIKDLLSQEKGLSKKLEKKQEQLKEIEKEIKDLSISIKTRKVEAESLQTSINQINKQLTSIGLSYLKLILKDGSYYLERDGIDENIVELSSGEKTVLAFLYFLQLVVGNPRSGMADQEKLVVIDDPFSELDTQKLSFTSLLLKKMIKKILNESSDPKQLFVFSHNTNFLSQISASSSKRKNVSSTATISAKESFNNIHYFILTKEQGYSTLYPLGQIKPILNSYQLLWQQLQLNIPIIDTSLPNIMRKIIETYFVNLGGYSVKEIPDLITSDAGKDDSQTLLRWIYDESDNDIDAFYSEFEPSIANNYKTLFKKLFLDTGHIAHYNMMMRASKPNFTDPETSYLLSPEPTTQESSEGNNIQPENGESI